MASRKTSVVWRYFNLENENKVVCRLCQKQLAYNHSTGAMRNHIRLKHLDVNLHETTAADASGASHTQADLTLFTRRRVLPSGLRG